MEDIARSPEQIGNALRRKRKADGLLQAELAAKARTRQATVSRVEGGDRGTKLGTLFSLMAALNLELVVRERTRSDTFDIEELF